jgi:GDP-mannose transporter
MQYLSIPCFTIFKNLTIILIAYAEQAMADTPQAKLSATVTPLMLVSFSLLVLSSVSAGWSDIVHGTLMKASASGAPPVGVTVAYGWMVLNCLTTAGYALMMRVRIKAVGFKDFDTVFYNNLICIPILLAFSFLTEMNDAASTHTRFLAEGAKESHHFQGLMMAVLVSSVATFAISYSTAWCVRLTSSTTYSMVGALNKLPISISGMLFFSDPVTFGNVFGVIVAFLGGLVYNHAKNVQKAALALAANTPLLPVSLSSKSMDMDERK